MWNFAKTSPVAWIFPKREDFVETISSFVFENNSIVQMMNSEHPQALEQLVLQLILR